MCNHRQLNRHHSAETAMAQSHHSAERPPQQQLTLCVCTLEQQSTFTISCDLCRQSTTACLLMDMLQTKHIRPCARVTTPACLQALCCLTNCCLCDDCLWNECDTPPPHTHPLSHPPPPQKRCNRHSHLHHPPAQSALLRNRQGHDPPPPSTHAHTEPAVGTHSGTQTKITYIKCQSLSSFQLMAV
jgi:hypothetical protein